MANEKSEKMLAFNFAIRRFAYRKLAQGLSWSLQAFPVFLLNLDLVIKANQCAQYVDDLGIAANDSQQLICNLKSVFACIQETGWKLTMAECQFGVKQVDFRGRGTTPQGVSLQKFKIRKFLENFEFPWSKKSPSIYRIFEILQKLLAHTSWQTYPDFSLLKTSDAKAKIVSPQNSRKNSVHSTESIWTYLLGR